MFNLARRGWAAAAAAFSIAATGILPAQTEVTVNEDYAPPPEYRVFGKPANPADPAAIADLMRGFGQAWGTQDVDGAVKAYTEDTESDWGVNRDGSELRRVHITYVLEKQPDGEWLIAHQMIMDARR